MKPLLKPQADCPCGSSQTYGDCCGKFHAGQPAPTPEALMRSRYSAYVLRLSAYLLQTWHASTAPGDMEFSPSIKWTGLDVLHTETSADAGVVEFVARFKDNGKARHMRELSRFVNENRLWLYVDGVQAEAA